MKSNKTEQKKNERVVFVTIDRELRDMDAKKECCICDIVKCLVGHASILYIMDYCCKFEDDAALSIERIRRFATERDVDEQLVEMAVTIIEYDVKYIQFVANFYISLDNEVSLAEGEIVDEEPKF